MSDDKSPLLLNCIVCKETMKLEKSAPDAEGKVKTPFSIVASGATELSGCDSSAEVAMRRTEGEREIIRCRLAGKPDPKVAPHVN